MRIGFIAASRWPAIWAWYRWRTPAAIGDGWDTSPSRGVRSCAFCWWKRPGDGTPPAGMAHSIFSPRDAAGTQDLQGSDGSETGRLSVLDVAQRMELRADDEVRFARGRARKSPWCAVERR